MVPSLLKETIVPGTLLFLLLVAGGATLLLYRTKDNGRAGRRVLTVVLLLYWALSTPLTATPIIRALSPDYGRVRSRADAAGATAIVVLSGGLDTYYSNGAWVAVGSREHWLRSLEAARVYHLLDRPWVIASGQQSWIALPETTLMVPSLQLLGIDEDRIVEELQSRNTHEHTQYLRPILAARGIKQFVLVTSQQHMARSLRTFRAAGFDPVPSSPEFFALRGGGLARYLPSRSALEASNSMLYDLFAMMYYRARGWA